MKTTHPSITLSSPLPPPLMCRPAAHLRSMVLALVAVLMCLSGLGSSAFAQRDVATASAVSQRVKTAPGDQFAVAIILDMEETWHAWPNVPVLPEGVEDLVPIPTTLSLAKDTAAPEGVTVHIAAAQWPTPHEVESAGFTGSPIKVLSLAGRSVIFVPVVIGESAKPGEVILSFAIEYQACDDTTCLRKTTAEASVKFEVLAAGGAVASLPDEKEFAGFDPKVFAKIASGESGPAPVPAPTPIPGPAAVAATPQTSLFGYTLPDPRSPMGVVILLLVSMVGGAVMNLTPCVLPVIPIKIMTLTQHAASSHGALRLGLWMALGIVVFWTAIGVPMAFVSSALDPSRFIFGIWWVTLTIGVIIVMMGLGIMGLFNLTLPQSVYAINPKADTAWGSFVFGIMTAVLGLPCFGFVAGGLLAAASTLPSLSTLSIFFGIGVGMAAPFLLLAARPQLLKKMPRTGPASELVKQVMGLMLLAAAAYFIAIGFQTLSKTKPYVGATMHWWTTALLLTAAGVWLMVRTFGITKKMGPRVVFSAVALLLIAGSMSFAISETAIEKENYLKLQASHAGGDEFVTGAWNHYTPARFEKARASGKVVVADYTANWCLICKSLKRTVLDVDPVRTELMRDDVVVFEVDLTADDAPGWKFLHDIGRVGIPTLAIFKPGVKEPEIFNAYTPETVMEALKRARPRAGIEGLLEIPSGSLALRTPTE